jgi:peroxiredoxin
MNIRRMEGDMGADLPRILKDLSGLEGLSNRQELIERMEMVIEKNKEIRDILDRFKLSDKNEEKR